MADSVLGYFKEVPIVSAKQFEADPSYGGQIVQTVAGHSNDLNGAKRLNGAWRLNILNDKSHSEHCRACKERVRELLTAIYGYCYVNHSFSWPAGPGDYEQTPIGAAVRLISAGLEDLRGHRDFIKSPLVPPCDYYVPNPPFILEFDESQHFSHPRFMTLSLYPEYVQLGFPLHRWQELCREIDAKDDEPIDRDERRAWYDTLRDLVPALHGFEPTVRLYAGEFEWCSLSDVWTQDQELFKALLKGRLPE